jgi:hypothetical protein
LLNILHKRGPLGRWYGVQENKTLQVQDRRGQMMDKKRYYVAVGPGEVMENQGDASYEFEIEATEEDIDRLQELFEEKDNADQSSYVHSHLPFVNTYEGPNKDHDYYLREVYRLLHELGTAQTKEHIEQMKVLQ